jgi:hypothetical protein
MIFIWYLKIIITFAPNGAVRFRAPLTPLKRRGFVFSAFLLPILDNQMKYFYYLCTVF